ncbi:MAG: CDP-glucose 4,6-dehydratase [Hyphomicrobiaceae bacterium]|nr:CDP-glucose 4,6-dehydratase [Hyphomicrobiaceae bacterium]
MNPAIWAGRRVLVTGHTGFKGAWLAYWLQSLGASVAGLSLDPITSPNLCDEIGLSDRLVRDFRININHADAVLEAFDQFGPEFVFHLAAQAIVIDGYQDPVGTFATNVVGTVNVLEAIRKTPGLGAALIVTSDKCYENETNVRPHLEEDPLGGADPYSASKACAEIATASYMSSFLNGASIPVATARAGNVIGGGDWSAHRLVPDCVRSFAKGEAVVLRNPDFVRPWQHVLDSLSGYLVLSAHLLSSDGALYAGAWNFAPDAASSVTVDKVAAAACAAWGDGAQFVIERQANAVKESRHLSLDAQKASAQLGWQAHWGGLRGVTKAIEWYRGHYAGENAASLCDRQLDEYARLLRP